MTFYSILRLLFFPIILFLSLLSKKIKERIQFENKNKLTLSQSFKLDNIKADYAFHFSSEGEFEQARPLIDFYLNLNKKIELIYTSDSVEVKTLALCEKYKNQIRVFRLPILTFNPLDYKTNILWWSSSEVLFMVRYDFFPELIYAGKRKSKFILLNASLKNKQMNFVSKFYLDWCFQSFDFIISASKTEKESFERCFSIQTDDVFDFRVVQILKRIDNRENTLNKKWINFNEFAVFLKQEQFGPGILYGSFWDYEAPKLEAKRNNLHVIAPHKITRESISEIQKGLNYPSVVIDEASSIVELISNYSTEPLIIILNIKGVLCELYPYFSSAYVGGGFGESVHSVLEPYLGGCKVYCGPNTYRSTEVDYIRDNNPKQIQILKDVISIEQVSSTRRVEDINVESLRLEFNRVLNKIESLNEK